MAREMVAVDVGRIEIRSLIDADVLTLNGSASGSTMHAVGYNFDGTIAEDSYGSTEKAATYAPRGGLLIHEDSAGRVGPDSFAWLEDPTSGTVASPPKLHVWDILNGQEYEHSDLGDVGSGTNITRPFYVDGWLYWAHRDAANDGANTQLRRCRCDCTDVEVVSSMSVPTTEPFHNDGLRTAASNSHIICTNTELMWINNADSLWAVYPINGDSPYAGQAITPLSGGMGGIFASGYPSSVNGGVPLHDSDLDRVTQILDESFAQTALAASLAISFGRPHTTRDGSQILVPQGGFSAWKRLNYDGSGSLDTASSAPAVDSRGNRPIGTDFIFPASL